MGMLLSKAGARRALGRSAIATIVLGAAGCGGKLGDRSSAGPPSAEGGVGVDAAATPEAATPTMPGADDAAPAAAPEGSTSAVDAMPAQAPPEAATAESILATGKPARAIGTDDERVYFLADDSSAAGDPPGGGTGVYAVPKNGGPLVALGHAPYAPHSLAVDADAIYFISSSSVANTPQGHLWRTPKTGGVTQLVVAGDFGSSDVAVSREAIYWVERLSGAVVHIPKVGTALRGFDAHLRNPEHFALGPDAVYAADDQGVTRIPLDGSSPVPLWTAPAPLAAIGVQLYGDALYVAGAGVGGSIVRIPLAGGPGSVLLAALDSLWAFGVAPDRFYVTMGLTVELATVPSGGGPVSVLRHTDQIAPSVLALDSAAVYWSAGGQLLRTPF